VPSEKRKGEKVSIGRRAKNYGKNEFLYRIWEKMSRRGRAWTRELPFKKESLEETLAGRSPRRTYEAKTRREPRDHCGRPEHKRVDH